MQHDGGTGAGLYLLQGPEKSWQLIDHQVPILQSQTYSKNPPDTDKDHSLYPQVVLLSHDTSSSEVDIDLNKKNIIEFFFFLIAGYLPPNIDSSTNPMTSRFGLSREIVTFFRQEGRMGGKQQLEEVTASEKYFLG